jgi:hypothetical protein
MATEFAMPSLLADGVVHTIATPQDGAALGALLLDQQRSTPVVVVSIHPTARGPYLPAPAIARELAGIAPVCELHATATHGLTNVLGHQRRSVFFGAARIYPAGLHWLEDEGAAPLHLCWARSDPQSIASRVIDDALEAVVGAGSEVLAEVRAKVVEFHERLAWVESTRAERAVLRLAALREGIPAARLVQLDQDLVGSLRDAGTIRLFQPDVGRDDPWLRARELFPSGAVALVRVSDGGFELHPDVAGRFEEPVDAAPGTVVAARLRWAEDGLRAVPSEGDAAAMSVLPGGPAWLTRQDRSDGSAAAPVDVRALRAALRTERSARRRAEALVRELRTQLRAARRSATDATAVVVFGDPEMQLRHEVWLSYLARIPEPERTGRPMVAEYRFGPAFVGSLEDLDGVPRGKVVEVLVEVLTGLDRELAGRARRPWRVAPGAGQEVRADGARAWRVNLQSNAPGARRLKFWTLPGPAVEFDFVAHHDGGLG